MQDGAEPQVLVVGFPRRHLSAAVAVARAEGRVTIPAGGPGDLDRAVPGTEVLLIVTGPEEVPAATWHARFVTRIEPEAGSLPEGLPPTWAEEHGAALVGATPGREAGEDDEEDEEDGVGPQAFFEVRAGKAGYDWPNFRHAETLRYEDTGNNEVRGGNREWQQDRQRAQVLGSFTWFQEGWAGSHSFKFGSEAFRER